MEEQEGEGGRVLDPATCRVYNAGQMASVIHVASRGLRARGSLVERTVSALLERVCGTRASLDAAH